MVLVENTPIEGSAFWNILSMCGSLAVSFEHLGPYRKSRSTNSMFVVYISFILYTFSSFILYYCPSNAVY